jgi:hypothetical protein
MSVPPIPVRDLEAIYRKRDWTRAEDYRPTRHRVVPGESRLVMFFRLNGEVWTEVFALVAVGLAVAVVAGRYLWVLS